MWASTACISAGGSAAVLVAALIGIAGLRFSQNSADPFASFAADTHVRYSRGKLPLDVRDPKPQAVAAWLTQRLPFKMTLPDYPEGHSLLGARLTRYRDDDVAYLAYEMNGQPISLLVGSSARIVPAGGQLYQSGGVTFHETTHQGLSTITWIDKGYSYALVSDHRAVGAESCAICHGQESDRTKFAPLRRL
jgi:anti-sigma factor RsiW